MKLFISYRRDDSQHQADRLHLALQRAIPKKNIFIDIDGIPAGVDFVKNISDQVGQCDILLALIGPDWLQARDTQGRRRLDNPEDFVRIEIAAALNRGIPVAPVLLDDARMPQADELPPDLAGLTRRNAVEVRRTSFDADARRLMQKLGLGGEGHSVLKRSVLAAALVALAVAAIWAIPKPSPDDPTGKHEPEAAAPAAMPAAKPSPECGHCPATTPRSLPDGKTLQASEPVTTQQWQGYCAEISCKDDAADNRSRGPATLISWATANQYAIWLSQKTGRQYRLPNVEEVEFLQGSTTPEAGKAFSEWTRTCHDDGGTSACTSYEIRGWDRQGRRQRDWHTAESRGNSTGFRVVADPTANH
ncbi:MAG TPA: TIR domain-containing protein [Tahibacter sp.]|nr:TIR domain-containing protein [Tahibacter sp.]